MYSKLPSLWVSKKVHPTHNWGPSPALLKILGLGSSEVWPLWGRYPVYGVHCCAALPLISHSPSEGEGTRPLLCQAWVWDLCSAGASGLFPWNCHPFSLLPSRLPLATPPNACSNPSTSRTGSPISPQGGPQETHVGLSS